MSKHSIVCAGIDTGKYKLDVALNGSQERLQVDNTPEDHKTLWGWLRKHRVKRVGIEASGGYEQEVVGELRRKGIVVVVFQPAQVRAYATFLLQLAKNDKIDAGLIAECTAAVKKIHDPPDPRLAPFAERQTTIEQIKEDITCCKTRLETSRSEHSRAFWKAEIARLKKLEKLELKQLVAAIRQHRDLAERLDLIVSVDSVGLPTAVAILVRMPEIGRLTKGQAAALAGLAPYDDDSGQQANQRHIRGGRERLRGALYCATTPGVFRGWNKPLSTLYQRLIAKGKLPKVAHIACARKLLVYVNTVVARGTPWLGRSSVAAPAIIAR